MEYVGDAELLRLLDDVKISVGEDLIENWKKQAIYNELKSILLNERNIDIKLLHYLIIGYTICNVVDNTRVPSLCKEEIVD